MYMQVYFHPVSRSMEVILDHLLERANDLYQSHDVDAEATPHMLLPFFNNDFTLQDYLRLDDGVLNTYFNHWRDSKDKILADLATRFLDRRPLKSARIDDQTKDLVPDLQQLIERAGFNSHYYTAINDSYDLPYDAYDPKMKKPRTQIELMQEDGSLVELSTVSDLVRAITGKVSGDQRFFFPKEMLSRNAEVDLFDPIYEAFQKHIQNDRLIV